LRKSSQTARQHFDPNAIKAQISTVNFDLQTPFITQYNLGIQQALPGDWDVFVGYVGSHGKNLFRLGDANLAPETIVNGEKVYQPQLGRRNPNFTAIFQRVTDAESFYDSLQVSLIKRYSRGLRAQVSYTLAKSIDDASGINSQDFDSGVQYGLDWYEPTRDRGPSAFASRHNLTFNWSWDLPIARSANGVAGALLKGWQLNNVTTLQSGQPFTVRLGFNRSGNLNTTSFSQNERPNLKPGYSSNPVLGGPDRYWDINAFELPPAGQRGNLGRNSLIGPGLINSDQFRSVARQVVRPAGWTERAGAPRGVQLPESSELRGPLGTDRVHQCRRRRRTQLGAHHVDGHHVAADSDRCEIPLLMQEPTMKLLSTHRSGGSRISTPRSNIRGLRRLTIGLSQVILLQWHSPERRRRRSRSTLRRTSC
jgi:hypothetical protein